MIESGETFHNYNKPGIYCDLGYCTHTNFTPYGCAAVLRLILLVMLLFLGATIAVLFAVPYYYSVINVECNCDNESTKYQYNFTYPLTEQSETTMGTLFRIAVITDLDLLSKSEKVKNTWFSYMRFGSLVVSPKKDRVKITFDSESKEIKSTLSQGGRSMELSDLKVFDGKLVSVDDRTGVVYRISPDGTSAVAWAVLPDGPGDVTKGFKGEWLTVKDQWLYVGGLGKEWTTTEGVLQNHNPMWVKRISPKGEVEHLDWVEVYKKLRAAAGIYYPGYMIHESAQWSDIHKRWFFLPRRASNDTYTEEADESRASNYMLIATEDFSNVNVRKVTPLTKTRGFSAFQFIPGTFDQLIVALKSEEISGVINSYVTVFDVEGNVLLDETILDGNFKFEGIEFV